MIDEVAKLGEKLIANIKHGFGHDDGVLHLLLPLFFFIPFLEGARESLLEYITWQFTNFLVGRENF